MEPYQYGDRRMPHHCFPPKQLTIDQLHKLSGVLHYKVDLADLAATKKRLTNIRQSKNKVASDVLKIDENVRDFERLCETLYEPVEKKEDEVFMILDGSMYFDINYDVEEEEWIRIYLERGDLIVIPKGKPFRCTCNMIYE
uniref:1,2-dihydroxy-3-keto-5-methylthiopentene dioxygenase n=1 Tax=Panagrolaimus sp. ES5 TaxID=591445 RepID=A0AC34F587_9BILA